MSAGQLAAIAIVGVVLALSIAQVLRHRRDRRENADRVRLIALDAKCVEIMSSLDRYSHVASATTVRVSRAIADQFNAALVEAQSIHDGRIRKQAVAVLGFRPASEGADWVDIYDPKALQRSVSDLTSEFKRHIKPERGHKSVDGYWVPGRARRLRNKLFGFARGERWT